MSYKRADDILPENILEILQLYVSGEAIYVPKKKECRKGWGSSTGVREKLRCRNEQILEQHRNGVETFVCKVCGRQDILNGSDYRKKRECVLSFFHVACVL